MLFSRSVWRQSGALSPKSRYVAAIASSNVKTVANMHIHSALS